MHFYGVTMRETDHVLVVCVAGHYKREWLPKDPQYQKVLDAYLKDFPELKPGKRCTFLRYEDGTTEVEILDLDSGQATTRGNSQAL